MGERKIPAGTGVIMIALAFVLDLINLGVDFISFGLLGWLVDFVELCIFSIWFSHYDAGLWSRSPGLTILTTVVDAVPFGDITFPWTWRVAYGVITEREG